METIPEVLPADDQELQELRELGIATTADGNVVKFGRWQQATKTLTEIAARAEAMHVNATALKVTDHESRERAGVITAQLKAEAKTAEATVTPFETPLKRVLEFIRQKRQKIANRCEEARGILASKMSEYDRAEEAKAAAERKRQQEALDAEANKQAKQELKAGDIGKREYKERVENTPQVNVAPAIPKVAGNVRRVNHSAACTDVDKFIMRMIQAHGKDKELYLRLRECVVVSDQKLSAEARKLIKTHPQDEKHPMTVEAFKALYPFVEVREDRSY